MLEAGLSRSGAGDRRSSQMMRQAWVVVSTVFLSVSGLAAAAPALSVALNPSATSIPVVTATASVAVHTDDDASGVNSFSFGLTFVPGIVQITDVQRGGLYLASCVAPSDLFSVTTDNATGKLCVLAACQESFSGSGDFITISLQGQGVGTGALTFSPDGCVGLNPPPNGCQMNEGSPFCAATSGSVTVQAPAPTPTPTPSNTPTSTPTNTPTNSAQVLGAVTLQGRPTPPNARWSVPLRMSLTPQGGGQALTCTPTTDQSGNFSCGGFAPGTYTACVKQSQTLRNCQSVSLVTGNNPVNFGTLLEGDANDDNCVQLVDFSILATTFGKCTGDPGFDARADFDLSGCVVLVDFSLQSANFGQCGAGGSP